MKINNQKIKYKSLMAYDILRLSKKYPENSKKRIDIKFFSEHNQKVAIELLKPFQNALEYLKEKNKIIIPSLQGQCTFQLRLLRRNP